MDRSTPRALAGVPVMPDAIDAMRKFERTLALVIRAQSHPLAEPDDWSGEAEVSPPLSSAGRCAPRDDGPAPDRRRESVTLAYDRRAAADGIGESAGAATNVPSPVADATRRPLA